MRDRFIKKIAASVLSAAIAVSMLPYAGMMDASAKAPFVKLHTTFKTLTAGQTYKLKLKNNTLGWKVTKAVSTDSAVCRAANKKSYVKLTAKSEGRTTVRVTLKTAKRKGAGAVKKLSCRVNVKPVEVMPDTPAVPDTPVLPDTPKVETDKTVESQEALEKALADENVKKITIKTDSEKTFTIASGEHKDVDVIVDAPKADVDNSGVFKSITIKAIKDSTWFEKAVGNAIRVEALKTRIVVEQSAVVADISLVTQGADVGIDVRGAVKDIHIRSKLSAVISGSVTEKIPVTVDAVAADAALTFSIPVKVTTAANISVIFQKGAEDSTLDLTEKTISVKVETSVKIEVEKADGTKQTISANRKATITYTQPVSSPSSGNGSSYVGSSPGTNYPPSDSGNKDNTNNSVGELDFDGEPQIVPDIDKGESWIKVTYKVKNASPEQPAEIFNVISTINTDAEITYDAVIHGHLGKVDRESNCHEKADPSIIDYLRVTDTEEHSYSYNLDVFGAGFNINEGYAVYSVIKGNEESLHSCQKAPQDYKYETAPRPEVAYHNQAKDKVYVYFGKNLDTDSIPSRECFTITPANAEQAATVTGVSIAVNPNNDSYGNYIELELEGQMTEGSRLSYAKQDGSACIQDTAQDRNAAEDFTIDIMPASPKITDVKVSADHKYMSILVSPMNAGNDFVDVFINGENLNIDAGYGVTYFDRRVISLANLPISQDKAIQSVEIKAKSGNTLTDMAFDGCDSIKYEGTITDVAEAKMISAQYSKGGKTMSIQTSGTDADLSQLYGCDLVLKVNGTEYELRGKFQKEWKDGQPSGNYTSDASVLKHIDIPENAEIYLAYNTKLTNDQFGDGRNKGVLTDIAGKPLLATTEDIRVTIID